MANLNQHLAQRLYARNDYTDSQAHNNTQDLQNILKLKYPRIGGI